MLFDLDSQPADAGIEGIAAHIQRLGGTGNVQTIFQQGLLNQLFLKMIHPVLDRGTLHCGLIWDAQGVAYGILGNALSLQ